MAPRTQQQVPFPVMEPEAVEETLVHICKNKIYFYCEVTVESVLQLCMAITKVENQMLRMQLEYNLSDTPNIYLYIRSDGGDAYAGLSAMDTIKHSKVPVITIVDGFAASAATFILMSGHERWMRENSHILIHQVRSESWMSKYSELKEDLTNTRKLMDLIIRVYKKHSNIPEKKLSKILNREMYLNPETCLKYGLIDTIY